MGDARGDGAFVGGAAVDAYDRGLLLGYGLFETIRAVGGRLPLWDRHMARLSASAGELDLPSPPPADALHAAGFALLQRAGLADGVLRVTLTAGQRDARFILTCRERVGLGRAVRLGRVAARRDRADPTARHKTTSRLFWILAQREAARLGADEALCCGADGTVLETTNANLFAELDGRWVTPPADGAILPGVARAVLLDAGMATERAVHVDELGRATRLAVTNAVHGPRAATLGAAAMPAGIGDLAAAFGRAIGG